MRNDTCLVKVVHTSFAPIVILNDYGLSLLSLAHIGRAVFCAHVLAASGDVGDDSVRESEGGGEDRSSSCLEQLRWKLRLVFPGRAHQGQFPPQQLFCQGKGGEKIVTGHHVSLEPLNSRATRIP